MARYVVKGTTVIDTHSKLIVLGSAVEVILCRCSNSCDAEVIAKAMNRYNAR